MTDAPPGDRRSPIERALAIVTDVHAGEGSTALLLTSNVFVLLVAYYVIKPVREGLILEMERGAEYKSWMGAATAIALVFAVPAYARFASRVPRNKLVVGVTVFFAAHLGVFYGLAALPAVRPWLGLIFYLWIGIFNMMVVAQFWAFANDIYDADRGRRLFPLVGIGASIGAPVGSQVAEWLVRAVGTYAMLLVSGALLCGCAALFQIVHARERSPAAAATGPSKSGAAAGTEAPPVTEGAFEMLFKHRYLGLLAVFSLVFTFANSNGEYVLSKLVKGAAEEAVRAGEAVSVRDHATLAYATFYKYVNIVGAVLQAFVVSRIIKHAGFRVAFFILPLIAVGGAVVSTILPVLAVVRLAKIAENSTDYSLNNTLRNMLWLPTTREMKYKAKQAVDTFCVRLGDVASAGLVAVGAGALGWGLRHFLLANLALVALWLLIAAAIAKRYAEMTEG